MLTDKIAQIVAEIGPLVRDGKHAKGFSYLSANQIKAEVAPIMARHGVAIGTRSVDTTFHGDLVLVTAMYVLAHGDERLECAGAGAAQLTTGKGALQPEAIAIAQTRSLLSALRAAFMIAEADDERDRRRIEDTREERIDPGLRERRRLASTVRQTLTSYARAKGCPNRGAVEALRDMLTGEDRCPDEGERDTLREALLAAAQGDWSAIGAMCDDRGIEWTATEEEPVTEEKAEPVTEEKANPYPALANPRGNNPEQHRDYWAAALRKTGDERLVSAADKLCGNPNVKASATALATIYQRLRAGDSVEDACVAGRDAWKEAAS